uniref:Uncharacterized protein n=1 Tax=Myoviridae sp. ctNQr16 TaxID=2826644 RepID=A0A8S5MAH3_9CAUD|nr:MAG TPA: hypothetical protein [Myoviridae sp. ctNQr16]
MFQGIVIRYSSMAEDIAITYDGFYIEESGDFL